MKRWWCYVLELENNKWYVGITTKTPEERFDEHRLGKRAAYWTKKYKPIKIELFEELGVVSKEHAEEYENKITRSLMKERGLNNVRGGDLRDVDEYVKMFGWIYLKDSILMLVGGILLIILSVTLLLVLIFD